MSPRDTSLVEEEGADVEGDQDGAAESNCCDLNYALLRLTVAGSMAHMTKKWSEEGKGTEKLHKIRIIAEGKMGLSRVAVSSKHIYNRKNKM